MHEGSGSLTGGDWLLLAGWLAGWLAGRQAGRQAMEGCSQELYVSVDAVPNKHGKKKRGQLGLERNPNIPSKTAPRLCRLVRNLF